MNDNEAQIKKAEQLLYRLIDLCYESAQKKSLTVVHHGNRLDLTDIYYATKTCIEKLNRHESTKFLRMSVLKGALQNILECALVNLNDLVEQKSTRSTSLPSCNSCFGTTRGRSYGKNRRKTIKTLCYRWASP